MTFDLIFSDNRQLFDTVGKHCGAGLEDLKLRGHGNDVSRHDLVDRNTRDVSNAIFHQVKSCKVFFVIHQLPLSWEQLAAWIRVCDNSFEPLLAVYDQNVIQMVAEHKLQNLA